MFSKYKIQTGHSQFNRLKKRGYLAAAVLFAASLVGVLVPVQADAYGQITGRSIQLGSTQSGATNVAYKVSFTTVTNNQNLGSIVVKFCANSPILGDSCSNPTNFVNTTAGTTLSLNDASANLTGFSINRTASAALGSNYVVLSRTTASAFANSAVSFTLGNGTTNGITNPTLTGGQTFYARIITYSSTDGSGNETTNPLDAGGIAMSLANQLNVTAKVQEALFFCVFTGADCAEGGNAVALGDQNGVLESNTTTYTSTAKFEVSSNAVSGVSVKLQGDTLKSGTFAIDAYGPACAADSTATGTERFGLRLETLGAGMTATAPYNCAAGFHGYDTDPTAGTNSLFGDEIAKTNGATDRATSIIEFAAKSANTSEAGIYTTTLTLIATATY